jgi:hypothetical protein
VLRRLGLLGWSHKNPVLQSPMEFAELVQNICKRPGMWVRKPYLPCIWAFLSGYDAARDGGPLAGFREWLIVRANGGTNYNWDGVVQLLLLPPGADTGQLTAEQEKACLEGMASLIEEYLRFRDENGITKVHQDYSRWLLRKRWYSGPLRSAAKRKR